MIDHKKFSERIKQLYGVVEELEKMFPGRPFTPDGHMVGSIGECLVADSFNLKLEDPSNKGFDAVSPAGVEVEIKATQADRVAFRSCPQHTIVIKIDKTGGFETVYNGPGECVWAEFEGKAMPSNGQHQIAISRLRKLNTGIAKADRI
jgi:hypothetical protein